MLQPFTRQCHNDRGQTKAALIPYLIFSSINHRFLSENKAFEQICNLAMILQTAGYKILEQ